MSFNFQKIWNLTLEPILYVEVCNRTQLGPHNSSSYLDDPAQVPSHLCLMPFADKLLPVNITTITGLSFKLGSQSTPHRKKRLHRPSNFTFMDIASKKRKMIN